MPQSPDPLGTYVSLWGSFLCGLCALFASFAVKGFSPRSVRNFSASFAVRSFSLYSALATHLNKCQASRYASYLCPSFRGVNCSDTLVFLVFSNGRMYHMSMGIRYTTK